MLQSKQGVNEFLLLSRVYYSRHTAAAHSRGSDDSPDDTVGLPGTKCRKTCNQQGQDMFLEQQKHLRQCVQCLCSVHKSKPEVFIDTYEILCQ